MLLLFNKQFHFLICFYVAFLSCAFNTKGQQPTGVTVQSENHQYWEIGIDVANVITFLKRDPQSHLVNIRYHFVNNLSLRTGVNLDFSDIEDRGRYYGAYAGVQYNLPVSDWVFFSGNDFSMRYAKNNQLASRTTQLGVEPFLGGRYRFSKHFSLSSEIKLNGHYFFFRNHESFAPDANSNRYRFFIGSVGMMMMSFSF